MESRTKKKIRLITQKKVIENSEHLGKFNKEKNLKQTNKLFKGRRKTFGKCRNRRVENKIGKILVKTIKRKKET